MKIFNTLTRQKQEFEPIKEGKEIVGNRTKIKIVKNKVAPPFRSCIVDMLYGEGISREGELLDLAVERDLIQKSGAWYSFNGQRIGQGRDNARIYIKEHPEQFEQVEQVIREEFLRGDVVMPEEREDDDGDDEDFDGIDE